MIDFNKTFSNKNFEEYKVLTNKLIPLKDGKIVSIAYSYKKIYIYDRNFQIITVLKFDKSLFDAIQLKTKEIVFLLTTSEVFIYNHKTFKFLSKTKLINSNKIRPERMFELSNSNIVFIYSDSNLIEIYKKNRNNTIELIKQIKTKYDNYSACEINNNNIAYNCSPNYKSDHHMVCFTHNDKYIKDLFLTCSKDSLYYFKEKYLIALGIFEIYIIDLNEYKLIHKFKVENKYFYYKYKTLCLINDFLIIPGIKNKIFLLNWKENDKNLEFVNSFNFDDSPKSPGFEEEEELNKWYFNKNDRILFLNKKIYVYGMQGKKCKDDEYALCFDVISKDSNK